MKERPKRLDYVDIKRRIDEYKAKHPGASNESIKNSLDLNSYSFGVAMGYYKKGGPNPGTRGLLGGSKRKYTKKPKYEQVVRELPQGLGTLAAQDITAFIFKGSPTSVARAITEMRMVVNV